MKIIFIILFIYLNLFSLNISQTKHLLNRTSFSYTQNDLDIYKKFTKEEAVRYLILNASNTQTINKPKNIKKYSVKVKGFKNLSRKKKLFYKNQKSKMNEIRVWWYKMMLDSRYSFREKMTLFWHNHFVSEFNIVKNPYFMYKQNKLLRDFSLARFDILLNRISKDFAMLIYLDNNSNIKGSANENYARELMELFTLGLGNYTEDDVKNSAKAFTGWRIQKRKMEFKKIDRLHDNSDKIFLNQKGNFDGEDIIKIILSNDTTSKFIITKLYKEFVGNINNTKKINEIANIFKQTNYNISIAMKYILLSDDFWKNSNTIVKSPSELIIGLYKQFNINITNDKFILKSAKKLGQELFNPPNVKGWIEDKQWLNSTTLVQRNILIRKFMKKILKKENIKKLNINSIDDFSNYFIKVNTNIKYKNSKSLYIKLLSKPLYQLK